MREFGLGRCECSDAGPSDGGLCGGCPGRKGRELAGKDGWNMVGKKSSQGSSECSRWGWHDTMMLLGHALPAPALISPHKLIISRDIPFPYSGKTKGRLSEYPDKWRLTCSIHSRFSTGSVAISIRFGAQKSVYDHKLCADIAYAIGCQ